jgi:hypothetical protein
LVLVCLSRTGSAQNLLANPESVVYDQANERYLVSNWSNGDIIAIDNGGQQSYFNNTDLDNVAGLHIVDNTLFAASNGGSNAGLIGYSLTDGAMTVNLTFPGMLLLNGIASDSSGFLYVSDQNANRIIKVSLSDWSYNTNFVNFVLPNGLEFDEVDNRLLVISESTPVSTMHAINLNDSTSVQLATLGTTACDGLTLDRERYVYFSSWATGLVYRSDPLMLAPLQTVSTGHAGPADIFFNLEDDILAIPNFNGNSVSFIEFPDSDGDLVIDDHDNCVETVNPDQSDVDLDGLGDVCDACTDSDGDGAGDPGFADNTCPDDLCPGVYDTSNEDTDGDGLGDACDECTDSDEDGYGDPGFAVNTCATDNCPEHFNPDQTDSDLDGIGDACDGCCEGRVGDANGAGGDEPTIGDITVLIDAKFIAGVCEGLIDCLSEADLNQSGGADADCDAVTIGDISMLIDYLFISGPDTMELPECL